MSSASLSTAEFLSQYEPLDIVGNGSFGVIRKVRRKVDGAIFARKELNFERMTERDRKQIVAEVNILKDLHHDHIVRYHDRHVDRDQGILYILMEFCGGGDLSSVIKSAQRTGRPIAEETIWNYFMQILLALQHCHHPNGHARSSSSASDSGEGGKERRPQILHRDLKPDNVFLDEMNAVKLGDFGLSKALTQATLAVTYVGTPYYMSPEVIQEKAYDSKSDIWSLGCLIYELCALHPPFHEAKTHAQLHMCIQNGRIPPLPRGYSPALWNCIKAMLNINPAMRPSATQLLQNERIDLARQISNAHTMFEEVKAHRARILQREREVAAREAHLAQLESHHAAELAKRDAEIRELMAQLAQAREAVPLAIAAREEELRVLVLQKEADVAARMEAREQEILAAILAREAEIEVVFSTRVAQEREAAEQEAEERLSEEWARVEGMREEVERGWRALEEAQRKSRKEKAPLEEVKNVLQPLPTMSKDPAPPKRRQPRAPAYETPLQRAPKPVFPLASAMKGVVLTASGEALATPAPALDNELSRFFAPSPKTKSGLGFARIFDHTAKGDSDEEEEEGEEEEVERALEKTPQPLPAPVPIPVQAKDAPRSPSKKMTKSNSTNSVASSSTSSAESGSSSRGSQDANGKLGAPAPSTRLRRPSIVRGSSTRPAVVAEEKTERITSSRTNGGRTTSAKSTGTSSSSDTAGGRPQTTRSASVPAASSSSGVPHTPPVYDLDDESNLPSPFLKKIERKPAAPERATTLPPSQSAPTLAGAGGGIGAGVGVGGARATTKRPSSGNMLRAFAAANNAKGAGTKTNGTTAATKGVARTRTGAGEEARKALLRT
ncbi:unnamed protein product [Peniophora sp. CBMAI 1063]|nr:unnamed protein product [Peniophora sp. CBMAI 1063]